ncbi:MAG: EAL domain-containing protein [Gammaproteobacteria bacterium]|nr:EAL domain-containing protein [Gammaproteobacteria bacterium]
MADITGSIGVAIRVGALMMMALLVAPAAVSAADELVFGVLAKRGFEQAQDQWQATADYLSRRLPDARFRLLPLAFEDVIPAVQAGRTDLVLVNSALYVLLERRYRVRRIATLRNRHGTGTYDHFGSVIFTRRDRGAPLSLADLAGKVVAAVDARSLGGYLMARRELRREDITPAKVLFSGTHDGVAADVLAGRAAAGIVRTDTIERMHAEGKLEPGELRVLADRSGQDGFALYRSTRLYPEWPIASLPHVPEPRQRAVAAALLAMDPADEAARAGRYAGWSVPANYQPVHELLEELGEPPYEATAHFNLTGFLREHMLAVILFVAALSALGAYAARTSQLNRVLRKAEARAVASAAGWEHIFNTTGTLMVLLDSHLHVTMVNEQTCRILGLSRHDILNKSWLEEFVPAADRNRDRQVLLKVLADGDDTTESFQSSLTDHAGGTRAIAWNIRPMERARSGDASGLLASGIDVTREYEFEQQLRLSREHFDSLVQKNRTGILIVNRAGDIHFANPAAKRLLGHPTSDLEGTNLGTPPLGDQQEMEIIRADGRNGIAEMSVSETEWRGERAFLVMLHDITERKEAEARIQHMAFHDALTGLPNRTLFNDRLRQAISRARRTGKRAAVMFMDLDRFKDVNDTLGHEVGDELLKAVAQRLPRCVRASDTVARMGGDEFTVLLEGIDVMEQATLIADKVHSCLGESLTIHGHRLTPAPSIGISLYPESGGDAETLLRRADSAMYHAKRHKGVTASIFSAEMEVSSREKLALENELRLALEQAQFHLDYQIKVTLDGLEPLGFEALLRWHHPQRGLIYPGQFIPLLENTALIIPVGEWILDEACRQLSGWVEAFQTPPSLAVNISARQLTAGTLLRSLERVLSSYPLAAPYLRLELTETAVIQELDSTLPMLHQLREMGISLHMDDFGTGYSSLSLLKRLPFEVVKLDRSFMHDLATDHDDQNVVRAAIAMAHNLNKKVIAEGVENEGQCRFLRQEHCDAGQGWLFGKPVAAAEVPAEFARFAPAGATGASGGPF